MNTIGNYIDILFLFLQRNLSFLSGGKDQSAVLFSFSADFHHKVDNGNVQILLHGLLRWTAHIMCLIQICVFQNVNYFVTINSIGTLSHVCVGVSEVSGGDLSAMLKFLLFAQVIGRIYLRRRIMRLRRIMHQDKYGI